MKVHRDDVIRPGHAEHVGHQLGGDGGSRLVLLVLSGVGETGYHGSYLKQAASVEHLLSVIIKEFRVLHLRVLTRLKDLICVKVQAPNIGN